MTKLIPIDPKNRHRSVLDMTRDLLSDDPGFVDELEHRLDHRQLVKTLAIARARAGLSQQEIAAKMGCSQSKISKIEKGVDETVSFGDFISLLGCANHEARIFVVPSGGTLADEVKMHAFQIKHLLAKMVQLAGNDSAITQGIAAFIGEAAFNLTRFTKMAEAALPKIPLDSGAATYLVEAPEPDEDPEDRNAANPAKQSKHQTAGRV